MDNLKPPSDHEIEISLFGPGYGESILVHIGNEQWLIIDSCLEPQSGMPAALWYFKKINVNVSKCVKFVAVTHWHDDHVRGISTIFRECESAKIVISGALHSDEFLQLIKIYEGRSLVGRSGIDEFEEIFHILKERKNNNTFFNPPIDAIANRLLYKNDNLDFEVYSLSPSDTSIYNSKLAFASLVPIEGQHQKRIPALKKNFVSVVFWIKIGDNNILLGGDLENTSDQKMGWQAILDEQLCITGKAGIFKVSHHGSQNADHPDIWSELLSPEPFAMLTPFVQCNKKLPSSSDAQRILQNTSKAYITSHPSNRKKKWKNKVVRNTLREVTKKIQNAHSGWGQLRFRFNKNDNKWTIDLFDDACLLSELL